MLNPRSWVLMVSIPEEVRVVKRAGGTACVDTNSKRFDSAASATRRSVVEGALDGDRISEEHAHGLSTQRLTGGNLAHQR